MNFTYFTSDTFYGDLIGVVFSNLRTSFLCCRHLVKLWGWWEFMEVNLNFVFDVCSVTYQAILANLFEWI